MRLVDQIFMNAHMKVMKSENCAAAAIASLLRSLLGNRAVDLLVALLDLDAVSSGAGISVLLELTALNHLLAVLNGFLHADGVFLGLLNAGLHLGDRFLHRLCNSSGTSDSLHLLHGVEAGEVIRQLFDSELDIFGKGLKRRQDVFEFFWCLNVTADPFGQRVRKTVPLLEFGSEFAEWLVWQELDFLFQVILSAVFVGSQ